MVLNRRGHDLRLIGRQGALGESGTDGSESALQAIIDAIRGIRISKARSVPQSPAAGECVHVAGMRPAGCTQQIAALRLPNDPATPPMKPLAVKDGQTFVFIGDSITDCGRRDAQAPRGSGYARMTIDLIAARYPARRIRFFNEGISGDFRQRNLITIPDPVCRTPEGTCRWSMNPVTSRRI